MFKPLVTFVGLLLASLFATPAVANERPNIVLLLADDLGWTGLGCFGSDLYETPHLDALAGRGLKFTNAYAACTVCSPTRASIMTGKYPARLHLTDFIAGQNRPYAKLQIPDWTKRLGGKETTIAEVLKGSGYRTGQGFDVSYERPPGAKGYLLKTPSVGESKSSYLTDLLTDKACEFIDQSKSEPFFLYFAYHVPHTPIQGRPDLVDYFTSKVDPNAIHKNPSYAAMVASLDQSVGRIVAQLERNNLANNTMILFVSDNGGLTQRNGKHDGFTENLPLRRGKGSAYEGGVRVPAIAYWPGVTQAGSVCDEPIITMDLFPTLQQLAGIAVSQTQPNDGLSLVPLLRDPQHRFDRDLFWHYPHYHAGGDSPYSAIRSGNYRLIEFHEDKRVELYDLSRDIGEQNDLSETLPAKTSELKDKLHKWRESVNAQMPSANPNFDPTRQQEVERQPKSKRPQSS